MSEAANLRLVCRPSKAGNILLFPYTLDNLGQTDVYAMHALPSADPDSGEARANETAATIIAGPEGEAIVGKFAAPLPVDRRIAVPVVPLVRHVPPGGSVEGSIEIPLPLAEISPYFADLTLRRYQVIDIRAVVLTIGYWASGRDSLVVAPVSYAPDLFFVMGGNPLSSARRVTQRFPTSGLQLFRRTDQYPRSLT
jgi:hypothetical protein